MSARQRALSEGTNGVRIESDRSEEETLIRRNDLGLVLINVSRTSSSAARLQNAIQRQTCAPASRLRAPFQRHSFRERQFQAASINGSQLRAPDAPNEPVHMSKLCLNNATITGHKERHHRHIHHHHHHDHHHQTKTTTTNRRDCELIDSPPCSSSASSASDSAFSQSQTTLGPDSECQPGKDCGVGSDRLSSNDGADDGNDKGVDEDEDEDDDEVEDEENEDDYGGKHFKIVWQKLSYKVPERRFARLSVCLSKLRQKWIASDEEQKATSELPAAVSTEAKHSHAKCVDSNRFHLPPSEAQLLAGEADARQQPETHIIVSTSTSPQCSPSSRLQLPSIGSDIDERLQKDSRPCSKQRKVIFSNLNGCVKSGQLTAILGPSGAGKTTFLKCLTSSIIDGVSGRINIRGGNGSTTSQHLKLCIIPQKDYLFDNLTVMENLLFASRIKNTQIGFDHNENVYRTANLLGIQTCLKLKTSRLSGGQYKRVSIAQELLSQPDILILDEPTSGLDSLTCYRTVSVLRELADMSQAGLLPPMAIVMTIHQPQIKIFNLFHHVYILSSMGHCVYEGKPEYLIDTVADRCKLLPPPDDQNPASFIIDLASEVYGPTPINQLIVLQRENFILKHAKVELPGHIQLSGYNIERGLSNSKSKSTNSENNQVRDSENVGAVHQGDSMGLNYAPSHLLQCATLTGSLKHNPMDLKLDMETSVHDEYKASSNSEEEREGGLYISEQLRKRNNQDHSFWLHTGLLMKRLWISMWRDSLLTTTRVAFHLIIPFVFHFVYSQKSGAANACPHVERELDIQDIVSDSNIQRMTIQHDELILTFENVSLFFLLLYSFSMCVLAVTALSFPLNMQILLKETTNGWYTMSRFVMAKTLADLPMELTMPMISVSIAYFLTGQPSSYLCWRMLSVTAVMTICSLISQTQGLLFGAYFMNNVQAAVFVSQASTLPWIMLSGFTTRVSQLPKILQWLSFGSIYRLGIESIVAVRYGFGTCPCDEESIRDTPPRIVGIPDQVRSVMSYYMDVYSPGPQTTTAPAILATPVVGGEVSNSSDSQGDIFGKIASTLARANTYGADILSCNDVRPFIMSAREVDESTLPIFLSLLIAVLIGLRILLFYVVRIRAG